jgi:hypothetical protein
MARVTFFDMPRLLFGLRSYQYWTLNPGQEATEPKLSPRDPVSAIRADERDDAGMSRDNVVV